MIDFYLKGGNRDLRLADNPIGNQGGSQNCLSALTAFSRAMRECRKLSWHICSNISL